MKSLNELEKMNDSITKKYLICKDFHSDGFITYLDEDKSVGVSEFSTSFLKGHLLEGNVDLSSGKIQMWDFYAFDMENSNILDIFVYLDFEKMLKEGILLDVTENDEKSKKAIAYYEAEYAMEKKQRWLDCRFEEAIDDYVKKITTYIHAKADYIIACM